MYFCIVCAASINTGQVCKQCADQAAEGSDRIPVIHCNFCGGSMRGRIGTECEDCEMRRLLREARTPQLASKKQRPKVTGEQQTLWQFPV